MGKFNNRKIGNFVEDLASVIIVKSVLESRGAWLGLVTRDHLGPRADMNMAGEGEDGYLRFL